MSTPGINDTIRLSQSERAQLLAELNRPGTGAGATKRDARRWSVPLGKAVCTTVDAHQRTLHHVVVPRNLSSGGMAFLLGGFMYTGTKCHVTLKGLDGKAHGINGRVVRCQHVRGHLHDIGVAFDAPIKPREFLDFGDSHAFTVEKVDVSALKGAVLVIEDNRADQRLYAHHFKGSGLEIQFAQDGETGLACLNDLPDAVFVDFELPDISGVRVIERARAAGYNGPMVLVTAESGGSLRATALKAGASEVLTKPFTPGLLHQAAAEFLLARGPNAVGASSLARMVSSADERSASGEMIEDFVTESQGIADRLQGLLDEGDLSRLRTAVQQVRGSAASYGFEALTNLAGEVVRSLDASQSVAESAADLKRLIAGCRSVRPRGSEAA